MEVRSVVGAQAMRYRRFAHNLGYIPDFIRAVQEKYKFLVTPNVAEMFPTKPDPNQVITFSHGQFVRDGRPKVIEHLQMFQLAVVAATTTSTDDSDFFLDDAAAWAIETFKVPIIEVIPVRAYVSSLEVEFISPLPDLLSVVRQTGERISNILPTYGFQPTKYEIGGLTFTFDPYKVVNPTPANFVIERRAGFPFEKNIFFSQAPLKTSDHIETLKAFEQSLLAH